MDELHPKSFTGLIIPEMPIGFADFVHGDGALGDLGLRVLVPDGNYQPYACFDQPQSKPGVYDTDDCTGFGYCRNIATSLNAMWKLGWLSQSFIDWCVAKNYIQTQNGKQSFMFDPQVLGIMSGTTSGGNWLQTVAENARTKGLLPAGTLPGVNAYNNANDYYAATVTPEMTALGLEFLSMLNPSAPTNALPYQWIGGLDEASALKACPLYVALVTCGGWNTPPVPWCNATGSNHCVDEIAHEIILDSYNPFVKQLSADYVIPYKMMVLTNPQKIATRMLVFFQIKGSPTLWALMDGEFVGFADPVAFNNYVDGRQTVIIELDQAEFNKVKSNPDVFKS